MNEVTIFLDIDGVLNRHEWCHLGYVPRINQDNVVVLKKILETPHRIIISSSWGVHIPEFGVAAFNWMFKTHGLKTNVVDGFNGDRDPIKRFVQIEKYVAENKIEAYCVIDDMDFGQSGKFHIKPHPGIGLEPRHYTQFKEWLGA